MKWGMNFTPEIREIIKIEIDENDCTAKCSTEPKRKKNLKK